MDALNKKISSILDEISNEIMCDAASGDMTCPASQTGGGLLSSCIRSSNKILYCKKTFITKYLTVVVHPEEGY